MAGAAEEVAGGTVTVCAACAVLLYAHTLALRGIAEYVACEGELGA